MGNNAQGVISNATPWEVKYTVLQDILQIQKQNQIKDWNLGGKLYANYSKKDKKEEKQEEEKEQKEEKQEKKHSGGKAGINIDGGYKKKVEWNKIRKQSEGVNIVTPGSSNRSGLHFKVKDDDRPHYLSIWVCHSQGDVMLMSNQRIQTEHDIRKCVWVCKGKIKMTQVARQPKTWRFAEGCGEQTNYPQGYVCTRCGRQKKCEKNCPEYAQYRGLCEN